MGFGNSPCVRQAFLETYNKTPMTFGPTRLSTFDYPERTGDLELVEMTKEVIERQTGQTYSHVFLTNGATGGVVISLRAYKQRGFEYCHTRNAPYYLRYPSMIKSADLMHCDEGFWIHKDESVVLLDMPSNPLGFMNEIRPDHKAPQIIDGVYLNRVYTYGYNKVPRHDIMIGSYSKLLGLNGLRIGWVATNDPLMAERLKELITGEYCGLSVASTEIIKHTIVDLDWDLFERRARSKLDDNREQWSKLSKYFGNEPVPEIGMFHYASIDKKCKKLLEKSKIEWTTGSSLGTTDDFGRFNMGQDVELVEKAVKTVLKMDKLK